MVLGTLEPVTKVHLYTRINYQSPAFYFVSRHSKLSRTSTVKISIVAIAKHYHITKNGLHYTENYLIA